jgi:rubrerythrin
MKILIDIPESEYKRIMKYCEEHTTVETVYARIWSGKVVEEQDRPIGHWKKESFPRNKTYYMCSECGRGGIGEYSYCPNCGAKMDSN